MPEITDPYDGSCEVAQYELRQWFSEWSSPFFGAPVTDDREWIKRILQKDREERQCLHS